MCKTFESLLNDPGHNSIKKVTELKTSLLSKFYQYLDNVYGKYIMDDLLNEQPQEDKKKSKNKKKNKKKKQKEEQK